MKVHDLLNTLEVPHVYLEHPDTERARDRARSLFEDPDTVAKAVLLHAGVDPVVAILPSSCNLDLDMTARVLGVDRVDLATEAQISRTFPDCERGVVPAFGSLYGLKTVIDPLLGASPTMSLEGNTHHDAVRMRYSDFIDLEKPQVSRIAALA